VQVKRAYKFRAYPTRSQETLTLKREGRRWYAIVTVETDAQPLPQAGREIGIDLGVARFATTSDGEVIANPRFLAESAGDIAGLQRRKARAERGSGNRKRIGRALAREWRKVRDRRRTGPVPFFAERTVVPAPPRVSLDGGRPPAVGSEGGCPAPARRRAAQASGATPARARCLPVP
jgi:probable transposase/helix-turn-helix protein